MDSPSRRFSPTAPAADEPITNGEGGDTKQPPREDGGDERPRGRPDHSHLFSLKIVNLSFDVNEEDLREDFGKFGPLGDVYIPKVCT